MSNREDQSNRAGKPKQPSAEAEANVIIESNIIRVLRYFSKGSRSFKMQFFGVPEIADILKTELLLHPNFQDQ